MQNFHPKDELLIALMKLRLGLFVTDISQRFGIVVIALKFLFMDKTKTAVRRYSSNTCVATWGLQLY